MAESSLHQSTSCTATGSPELGIGLSKTSCYIPTHTSNRQENITCKQRFARLKQQIKYISKFKVNYKTSGIGTILEHRTTIACSTQFISHFTIARSTFEKPLETQTKSLVRYSASAELQNSLQIYYTPHLCNLQVESFTWNSRPHWS